MRKEWVALLGVTCLYIGYKVGMTTEKEHKKARKLDTPVMGVPWELQEEAEKVIAHVAAITGDDLTEVDVKSYFKFGGRRVYTVDSDFKVYAVVAEDGKPFDVSEVTYDWA